jgi:intraflagellar transport protein 52
LKWNLASLSVVFYPEVNHVHDFNVNLVQIADYHFLPDTESLAIRPRVCLQETEELPRDFTKLFDHTLVKLDLRRVPSGIRAYEALRLKHESLTLISPQFDAPLPPLVPGVFPPCLRDGSNAPFTSSGDAPWCAGGPPLELFDLDEHFAPRTAKLSQVASKCTSEEDVEYFIRECGNILGIQDRLINSTGEATETPSASLILDFAFRHIVNWKCTNQEDPGFGM